MPRKTLILILILAAVTGILIFLAITSQTSKQPITTQAPAPTIKSAEKTAKVLFNPQNIDLSTTAASPTSSVDILVDSGGADISGVQVELQYDPKALTNVIITPAVDETSFFGNSGSILFNDVKRDTGRISYAVAISAGQAGKKGVGKIATLTFSKAFGGPVSTQVTFLDKTLVTVLGANESALKETVPLNITLSSSQTQFTPQTNTVSPSVTQ